MIDMEQGAVVHVVQHLAPGGLEVMALELARMQSARLPAVVLSLEGDAEQAIAAWPRLSSLAGQLAFAGKRPGFDPLLPLRLARLFRRWRPAIVHTHHVGPLLYAGTAARLAGVRARLHTEHDAWHLEDPRRRRLMRMAMMSARPLMIADAPHVATAVAEHLAIRRPEVVLNGVDTSRFMPADRGAARRALGLSQEVRICGIAARLERVKGVDVAIAALRLLPADVVLVIAGGGAEETVLRAQAEALGIASRVRFLGRVDDMARFYPALDLLLVPSRNEGLPLAPLEAQASGIRVVASEVGGTSAAIDPATGALVDAENPRTLADAVQRLFSAPVGDPRSFVQRTASLEATAARYLELGGIH